MKRVALKIYQRLPFPLAVALAQGRPNLAYYIRPGPQNVLIENYLGVYKVRLNTRSDIERRMLSGGYEPPTMAIISRLVGRGQTTFDVGANVGAVTLALAKAVGPEGRVDAFEPGPPICEKLRENIQLNPGIQQVKVHQLGLSDRSGELLWQESTKDPGNATIHWFDKDRPRKPVPVSTIDEFFLENSLLDLHFLKIDVEGMELKVITGGLQTIHRHRPAIYFESSLCDDEQKAAAQQIEQMLGEVGYRLYKVGARGTVKETRYPDLASETLALTKDHLALLNRAPNT